MPPLADEIVVVSEKRISECIAEQIVYVPVSQISEESVEVEKPVWQGRHMPATVRGPDHHGPDSAEHRHDTRWSAETWFP